MDVHAGLMQWSELAPCRVLNRSNEVGLNFSKPLQSQIIRRYGFLVPETLVTNDPDEVRRFHRQKHGQVVYKSTSYVQSVVTLLDIDDARAGSRPCGRARCSSRGTGGGHQRARAHGRNGQLFATAIKASAVDYRYTYLQGGAEKRSRRRRCAGGGRARAAGSSPTTSASSSPAST